METNRKHQHIEEPKNPLMEEKLSEFLIDQIHDAKGNDENPPRGVFREKLLKEAVEKGIIKEKEEEFIEISEQDFIEALKKISEKYKKQFEGEELEDRVCSLRRFSRNFGKNKKRAEVKEIEKRIKDRQIKTGLLKKIGLQEQIEKIIEEELQKKEINKIDVNNMEKDKIIEGDWKFPAVKVKIGKTDEKNRPSVKGPINGKPLFIKFPRFSEDLIEEIIKNEEGIPLKFIKNLVDKNGKEVLISFYDVLKEVEKKGEIGRGEINNTINEYKNFIKEHIEKKEITPKEAEREILFFMVPGNELLEWEEEIRKKLDIEKGTEVKLKNDAIKDLILGERKIEDIGTQDVSRTKTKES